MSAPERIWAMPSDDGWMSPYCGNAPHDGSTEYVRADLCDPTQDARMKRLVDAARKVSDSYWYDSDGVISGIYELEAALRALEQGEG